MEVIQEEIYFQDKGRMQKIDSVAGTLTNGWKLTVHWDEKLVNYVQVPLGHTEEEILDWWEDEKPKHIKHFVDFVEAFGLSAVIASINPKGKKRILFSNNQTTEEGLCMVTGVDVNHTEKLIELFITV